MPSGWGLNPLFDSSLSVAEPGGGEKVAVSAVSGVPAVSLGALA